MFALGINYLNGWAMAAADGARKEQAEWPPHPDRVFMALAAAWFETGQEEGEGDVLRWLGELDPPAIAASAASTRTPVTSFVPVNDTSSARRAPARRGLDKLRDAGLALVPEHRSRQPRSFPVAIPHDPTVHLIWNDAELASRRAALERLAAKVTHIGHSASFVQIWVEQDDCNVQPTWTPVQGVAARRFRVPSRGRLDQLARPHEDAWRTYRDNLDQIEQAVADLKATTPPPRVRWRDFPDAILLADEARTRKHPDYLAAKSGDDVAAGRLVASLIDHASVALVRRLAEVSTSLPVLVCAHAYEDKGVNAIPAALAETLGSRLAVPFEATIVQSNVVAHTGAGGYGRLARQARFEGAVVPGREYIMVDDFIGQGGTMANLRGWIESAGGSVVGAVGLTGKPYSAILNPTKEQLHELRDKHGRDFEKWWRAKFGHAFNCLTQSEARYLARSPDVDTIRDRLAAAERQGDRPSDAGSPREQKQRIKELKAFRAPTPRRPLPGRWQGYGRHQSVPPDPSRHSVFDPQIVVLTATGGRRVSLSATLKLTAALRGLLMRECPIQPPPEWFSGHRDDGSPSTDPHMALIPLAFVGAQHADGRIMGFGLVLPAGMLPHLAGQCLESVLWRADTGLPRNDLRLFDGEWFECSVELESREQPPRNLQPETWSTASRTWASVTPVVLNRHFDGEDMWERAAESVKDACGHIGLPRPQEVLLHPVSLVEGVPHSREFPQLTRKSDSGRQMHVHAVIVFEKRVIGPVMIGAGRFRGYGLCRPVDQESRSHRRD